jgi:hypothetical protein
MFNGMFRGSRSRPEGLELSQNERERSGCRMLALNL